MKRYNSLRNILESDEIDLRLKLHLYEASVCLLITFGCKSWILSKDIVQIINGANSGVINRFTGRTTPNHSIQSNPQGQTARQHRLRWVGHIYTAHRPEP